MIDFNQTETYGWKAAIRGMRNPMNSWNKSDSYPPLIGKNDRSLMMNLAKTGTDHRKFMRMIGVSVDILAPLYWWKEFDTYKVGTVANSCSTMHKITEKEFKLSDFSCEHISANTFTGDANPKALFAGIIECLNQNRDLYWQTRDKKYWWQIIQLLPSSYNQNRTVMMNYEVLANIYKSRKNHKLDEWRKFCDWIEMLPYSELITNA